MQTCGFQIIQALRASNHVQFDEDDVFDEQVNGIFPDRDPFVSNDHGKLLRDGESRLAWRVHQCVSYTFSRKPVPSAWSTVRAQPMVRLDRTLILSSPISIC